MFVKIVDVEIEKVDNGKGGYEKAEVIYDVGGDKRTQKVMSFASPGVFKVLKTAKKGDTFEVNVIKNPAGYNQWNSITPAGAPAAGAAPDAPAAAPRTAAGTTATKSTYETADERAARQRLIVRQSSLTAALATLTPGSKAALDPEQVKALAESYTDWVFEKVAIDLVNMEGNEGDLY